MSGPRTQRVTSRYMCGVAWSIRRELPAARAHRVERSLERYEKI